jgi:signal transduction histidine kinase
MMKQINAISFLAILGVFIVLLVFAGVVIWTTAHTLMLSSDVKEAIAVNTMYERADSQLDAEGSLARAYRFAPSSDVRTQCQLAAASLVKDLQAASSLEVGDPVEDQILVARVLSEHQRYLLAKAQLFAVVDTGDQAKALAIAQTTSAPLFLQMQQQLDFLVNEHSQEAVHRLAELDQSQQKSVKITPIVFSVGLVLLCVWLGVLQTYRRKFDRATQLELAYLEETARLKTRQVEEQRQLNQLKDQFMAHVSHELHTPLTAVVGYVELLAKHQGKLDAATQARWVDGVKQGCDELELLTNSILAAVRVGRDRQNLHLEPTVVAPMVNEVLAGFDPREVQAYAVRLDLPEYLTVLADRHALRQVLGNVIGNAFKYAPKQTSISISAALSGVPSESADAASQVCIRVQDAGPGIPPAELPLLFQQFVRLRRDLTGTVRGSGLGLYISRQLVEAMQGQIWAESSGKPGEGSCFCFTLPSAAQPASEQRSTTDGVPDRTEP